MIEALLRTSIARRWVVLFLVAAVGALGIWNYQRLPIDAVPDITPVLGYSDDLGVLVSAVLTVAMYVTDDVRQQARDKVGSWLG